MSSEVDAMDCSERNLSLGEIISLSLKGHCLLKSTTYSSALRKLKYAIQHLLFRL